MTMDDAGKQGHDNGDAERRTMDISTEFGDGHFDAEHGYIWGSRSRAATEPAI